MSKTIVNTGVYKICNIYTKKIYIGSAAKSFGHRWSQHKYELRNRKHHSPILQKAWDKYGAAAFKFYILERCSPSLCLTREQYYLDKFQSYKRDRGYNISSIAGSTLGIRYTEEVKRKLSTIQQRLAKDPERIANHKVAITKRNKDSEYKSKQKEGMQRIIKDPSWIHKNKLRALMMRCDSEFKLKQQLNALKRKVRKK